jgi:hypothetical protein
MWEVLRKETAVQKGKTALRVDGADAIKWLWERDESMDIFLLGHLALPGLWVAGWLPE